MGTVLISEMSEAAPSASLPIVLLHAYPLSRAMWNPQRQGLCRWGTVITPDLSGFGTAARSAEPSIAGMASRVLEQLDAQGVREPFVLGGLSMGGYVAFEVLRQAGDRVRGLGLFATRAIPDAPEQQRARLELAERMRREGIAVAVKSLPKLLGRTTLASRPNVAANVTAMIEANDADGVADALIAMAHRRDSTPLLNSIRCPTVILWGDEDALIPQEESERMQQAIPDAELTVIAQAGHLVNLEQPVEFLTQFGRFIERRVLAAS